MWKTTLYVLALTLTGAVFALGLLALSADAPSSAAGGGATASTAAAADGGAGLTEVPRAALAGLREADEALLTLAAQTLARDPEVLSLVDPARAVRPQAPVLRPNQPPSRASASVVPSTAELRARAESVILASSEAIGARVALVAADGQVLYAPAGDTLQNLIDIASRVEGRLAAAQRGLVIDEASSAVHAVVTVPVNGGTHWLLMARPFAGSLDELGRHLGGVVLTLTHKGALLATTAPDALRGALEPELAALRTQESLRELPAQLADGTVASDGRHYVHAVHIEPLLGDARTSAALVVSVGAAGAAAAAPQAAAASGGGRGGVAGVVELLKRPFVQSPPNVPLLVGGLSAAVLLALLAGVFVRMDRASWLRSSKRQLELADGVEDAGLSRPVAELVEAIREKLLAQPADPQSASEDRVPASVAKELEAARAEATRLSLELDTSASKNKQLQTQIEYARKEVTRGQERLATAEQARDELRTRLASLEKEVATLREAASRAPAQRKSVPAAAPALSASASAVTATASALDPALESMVDLEVVDDADATAVFGDTDALFASAFSALERAESALGAASTAVTPSSGARAGAGQVDAADLLAQGRTLQTPKVQLPPSRKATTGGRREAHDTAEVSGEEMSQLLDEIDTKTTGEFGDIEIPGEAYPSEEFPDLGGGSLEDLAEHLGSLSDSQVRRLDKVGRPPATLAADDDDDEEFSPEDEIPASIGGRTAQLWGVGRDKSQPGMPTTADRELRRTLPGGLRMAQRSTDDDDGEAPSHATAPPPWKKSGEPPRSLSPASLLEALKKRGQSNLPPPVPTTSTLASDGDASSPGEGLGGTTGPDESRVSRFSRGLLDKTPVRQPKPRSVSQSGLFSRTGSRVDIDPTNDSDYFKSLYDDFLETKKRCGEDIEKITLERFVNRLARNKKQLMDRYGCRTVRFQVYVKEGKAALKATPVK